MTLAFLCFCSFFFNNKMEESDTFVDKLMKRAYLKRLNSVLNHRWLTLGLMGGLMAFTVTLIPGLGGEFMPQLEEGNLWIRALLPRTVSLEGAARVAPKLRAVMAETPEVRGVMSHVGRPDDGTDITSFFNVEFNVPLKKMEVWRTVPRTIWGHEVPQELFGFKIPLSRRTITREEIQDELMTKFAQFPGINSQLLAARPRQRRRGGSRGSRALELQ